MTPASIVADVRQLRAVHPALAGPLTRDGLVAAVNAELGDDADRVTRGPAQAGGFALEGVGAPVFVIDAGLDAAAALRTLLLLWGHVRYAPAPAVKRAATVTRPCEAAHRAPALTFALAMLAQSSLEVTPAHAGPPG